MTYVERRYYLAKSPLPAHLFSEHILEDYFPRSLPLEVTLITPYLNPL